MVAIIPAVKVATKYLPIALEVARQLDRQLRPHVLAYRLARSVDGYVARWDGEDRPHWVVFPSTDGPPLAAHPPMTERELGVVTRELDRSVLRHHRELPEARARDAVVSIRNAPAALRGKRHRRRDDAGDGATSPADVSDAGTSDAGEGGA